MTQTTNYQLNQWEATDQVRRTDFNADNAKIDAAIAAVDAKADGKAAQSAVTALQAAVAAMPKIAMGTYVGTEELGASTTTTLTLPFEAKLLMVVGDAYNNSSGYFLRGCSHGMVNWCGGSVSNLPMPVTWNGCTVSWYRSDNLMNGLRLNTKGVTYHYFAIG